MCQTLDVPVWCEDKGREKEREREREGRDCCIYETYLGWERWYQVDCQDKTGGQLSASLSVRPVGPRFSSRHTGWAARGEIFTDNETESEGLLGLEWSGGDCYLVRAKTGDRAKPSGYIPWILSSLLYSQNLTENKNPGHTREQLRATDTAWALLGLFQFSLSLSAPSQSKWLSLNSFSRFYLYRISTSLLFGCSFPL